MFINGTSSTIFYYLLLFASASHGCSIAGVFDPPKICWQCWHHWEHAQCKLTPRLDAPAKRCKKRCFRREIPLESRWNPLGIQSDFPMDFPWIDPHGLIPMDCYGSFSASSPGLWWGLTKRLDQLQTRRDSSTSLQPQAVKGHQLCICTDDMMMWRTVMQMCEIWVPIKS